jgi:hypothetical protein
VNQFFVALLYGRAGRLTAKNGGFRPGQACWLAESQDANGDSDGCWHTLRAANRVLPPPDGLVVRAALRVMHGKALAQQDVGSRGETHTGFRGLT